MDGGPRRSDLITLDERGIVRISINKRSFSPKI